MVRGGCLSIKNDTPGVANRAPADGAAGGCGEAGKAMAVIMDPATVAPPSGSTDTLPAVPAGSAALMTGVVEPTAVTRAAKAPVARGR